MSGLIKRCFFGFDEPPELPTSKPLDISDDMCYHDCIDYKGFTEDYKFCIKCDAKHFGQHPAMLGKKKAVTND